MFFEKHVLKHLQNSQEKNCARVSFLIKLKAEAWNFIKKETLAQAFSRELSGTLLVAASTFPENRNYIFMW